MANNTDVYMDEHYKFIYKEGAAIADYIPDDVAALSSPHWLKYPPTHPFLNDFISICYGILMVINFFGNGTVLFLYLKEKSLRSSSNMLVINLAIADIFMMVTNGGPMFSNMFYENYWIFGKIGCILYPFGGGLTGCCAIWTMVFIGYDRQHVIVNGITAEPIPKSRIGKLIIFSWLYPCCVLIWPATEIWSSFKLEGTLMSCAISYADDDWETKSFVGLLVSCFFFTPLFFIMFFYGRIVKAVWSHEAEMKEQAKKMNVDTLRANQKDGESAEMKIARISITLVSLWYLSFAPYALLLIVGTFYDINLITPIVCQIPSHTMKIASCLNPVAYAISHPKFRKAAGEHMSWLGIGKKEARVKVDVQTESANTAA